MTIRSTKWSSLLIVSMMKITMHLTRSQKKHAASMKGENNSFFYYLLFLFFIICFSSVPASSPYFLPPLHSSSLADLFPLLLLSCCLTFSLSPFLPAFPCSSILLPLLLLSCCLTFSLSPFLPAFPCSSILLPLNLHCFLPSYSSSVLTSRFPLSQEERKSRKDGGSIEEVERCFGASTIHPRRRRCKCLLWTTHGTMKVDKFQWELTGYEAFLYWQIVKAKMMEIVDAIFLVR